MSLGVFKTTSQEGWSLIKNKLSSITPIDNTFTWAATSIVYTKNPEEKLDMELLTLFNGVIESKDQIMITLSDYSVIRPIYSLGALILKKWADYSYNFERERKILYFDTKTDFKRIWSNFIFKPFKTNFNLLFPQIYLQNSDSFRHSQPWEAYIPTIITSYSPSAPDQIIEENSPDWIVVNCRENAKIDWLEPIFKKSKELNVPLIAWTNNNFFENIECIRKQKFHVFHFPFSFLDTKREGGDINTHKIKPIYLMDSRENLFVETSNILLRASNLADNRLSKDACRIGRRLLNTIQNLVVPYLLYEADADYHWGFKTIKNLSETFFRFIKEIDNSEIYNLLIQARDNLIRLKDLAEIEDPAYWQGLLRIIDEYFISQNHAKFIFISKGRKEIFQRALLARRNLSYEDLQKNGIELQTLKEFRKGILKSLEDVLVQSNSQPVSCNEMDNEIIIIGFPYNSLNPYFDILLFQKSLSILIYKHQEKALDRQIEKWNQYLNPNIIENIEVLNTYCEEPILEIPNDINAKRIIKSNFREIKIYFTNDKGTKSKPIVVFEKLDITNEIEMLLGYDDGEEDLESLTNPMPKNFGENDLQKRELEGKALWIESAIEVEFLSDWKCIFDLSDTVQVVMRNSDGIVRDYQYVSSLRKGDEVIFINGENRTNLYGLIISRIHEIPAIEIHLSVIKKWREEFENNFLQKIDTPEYNLGVPFDILLKRMKNRGSNIKSSQTLRTWLNGEVLAPEDPDDLKRLAEELDLKFVLANYKAINKSAKRIRGLHRSLSTQLNRWLEEKSLDIVKGDNKIYKSFDSELGLSLNDFKDSILILKVKKIKEVKGPIYRENVGNLERSDKNE